MEIFGIGPLEFIFVLIIALVVLGPKGLIKFSRQAGAFIRQIVQSPGWRAMIDSTREIKKAQDQFMQDTGLQESLDQVNQGLQQQSRIIERSIRNLDQEIISGTPAINPTKASTNSAVETDHKDQTKGDL